MTSLHTNVTFEGSLTYSTTFPPVQDALNLSCLAAS